MSENKSYTLPKAIYYCKQAICEHKETCFRYIENHASVEGVEDIRGSTLFLHRCKDKKLYIKMEKKKEIENE